MVPSAILKVALLILFGLPEGASSTGFCDAKRNNFITIIVSLVVCNDK